MYNTICSELGWFNLNRSSKKGNINGWKSILNIGGRGNRSGVVHGMVLCGWVEVVWSKRKVFSYFLSIGFCSWAVNFRLG